MKTLIKKLFILLPMLGLLAFGGCKKSTDDIQEEKCKGVICNNGGTCVNGECDCAEGFVGPACSDEKAPVKMYLTGIKVTKFPATDGGGGWDVSSGPDIMATFAKSSPATTLFESGVHTNADPTKSYSFTINSPIEIKNPQDKYILRLYDYDDFDPNDYMDGTEFTPYVSGQKFPKTRIIKNTSDKVTFECTFTYVF